MIHEEITYEDVVKYDIDKAIKMIVEDNFEITNYEKWLNDYNNNPAKISNNPLLTDYNWVYDHVEEIYCKDKLYYQNYQSVEAYYTFFKAITTKYPLHEDYAKYMNEPDWRGLHFKWEMFAINLVSFISYSFDERLTQLLEKEDVMEYFIKYSKLYNASTLASAGTQITETFLKYNNIASYYTKDAYNLIELIKKYPNINIPLNIMLDDNVIKQISRTSNIESFYHYLYYVREQVSDQPFLDEHVKYCDKQVGNIKDGILPCYEGEYNDASDKISINSLKTVYNGLQKQVMNRIFKKSCLDVLPKKHLYQELSKYMIIGMFISRNYQTDPYNLLIDIETLYKFATDNNKTLRGMDVYCVLTSFENMSLDEIIEFYKYSKSLPLMDMLYDDWNDTKYDFITELNSSIYSPLGKDRMVKDGIEYFDITDIEEPILVHNTGIPIDSLDKIEKMIDYINIGYYHNICLSVQDQEHNSFYNKNPGKKTIKFAYGPLKHEKVGIIYHSDAYSQGINKVEIDNLRYIRTLYTLKSFMDKTSEYNEISYLIDQEPYLPIGVICEGEITAEEVMVASKLNIPILYRKVKLRIESHNVEPYPKKTYKHLIDKRLF